jgi:hypothetical protein
MFSYQVFLRETINIPNFPSHSASPRLLDFMVIEKRPKTLAAAKLGSQYRASDI